MNKLYKFWMTLLAIIGVGSFLYFLIIFIKLGPASTFNYFWLLLALLCVGLILGIRYFAKQGKRPPKWIVLPMEILVGIGFLGFIIMEGIIIYASLGKPESHAEYLIILGAKVNGSSPSLILQYRIEAGAEYLKQNPETMVIASGGQGADEGISEAQCIYNELVRLGIEPERILLEEQSTSTKENLLFSAEFLQKEKSSVVVTTTDFHIFRAVQLAKKCGYENVSGNRAKSVWWLIPTNYTREFFAILKDFLCGNL